MGVGVVYGFGVAGMRDDGADPRVFGKDVIEDKEYVFVFPVLRQRLSADFGWD